MPCQAHAEGSGAVPRDSCGKVSGTEGLHKDAALAARVKSTHALFKPCRPDDMPVPLRYRASSFMIW